MALKENSRQIFGRELLNERVAGFRLVDCLYTAASSMPRHTHEVSHLSIVIGGSYTERYDRRERECEAAMLIIHPPGEEHAVAFHKKGAHVFSIHLQPRWVERVRDYTKMLDAPTALRGLPSSIALRLYHEACEMDSVSPLMIESLALEIVAEASRQVSLYERGVPRWLEEVREALHARFAEQIAFSELARVAGVHPVYLAREFRRRFGCTMGEYVRRLRIEAACRLISKTDIPLNEIAARLGFYDQSHFANAFKRQTGLTPTRYRAAASAG
jgi:AraC family transcriptional regulator